ncbi:glycosyl transferase [Rhizobium sp. XQZ8]|uniref:glycosyltransferase family protein n=1 Tax=Rhizobium populisoli TaxID=2859785 RepID=UPI001CA484D9|nr:glycosyltransferase [Rhizobium populisoli]MBW6422389.1 glycosyl transferase [Rhizobium populisoli]
MPKVFFYVQHLLGIGHLARASRVAAALVEDGFSVTMVTGGLPLDGFPAAGIDHIQLQPAVTSGDGFTKLKDADGNPVTKEMEASRRDQLLSAYHAQKPDFVIIEAFPFGRRQVRFELLPLLTEIEKSEPRPLVLSSVRDILQQNRKAGRDEETVDMVKAHFDRVLVHGDRNFIRLEETFPLASEIAEKVVYTGLVAPPAPTKTESEAEFDVIVSAGGGAVGGALIEAAIGAHTILPPLGRWCIITGPNLDPAELSRLSAMASPEIEIVRFRKDFPSLLAGAKVSISQAGYNTVCDILQARCRAVLIPFAASGETEQTTRAEKLTALKLAVSVEEKGLSAENLAAGIREALALESASHVPMRVDGAKQTAVILRQLLEDRR